MRPVARAGRRQVSASTDAGPRRRWTMAPPPYRSPRSGPSPGSVAASLRCTFGRARSRGSPDDATPPVRAENPLGPVLHGPVARQVAAALLLAAAASGCTETSPGSRADAPAAERTEVPLVVFMDSAHPARVYDEETLDAGQTNADLLAERLGDLPIRRISETISPVWRRDGVIAALEPELIVIHYSGFREEDGSGPRERLRYFLTQFGASETEFVIYSRTGGAALDENRAGPPPGGRHRAPLAPGQGPRLRSRRSWGAELAESADDRGAQGARDGGPRAVNAALQETRAPRGGGPGADAPPGRLRHVPSPHPLAQATKGSTTPLAGDR